MEIPETTNHRLNMDTGTSSSLGRGIAAGLGAAVVAALIWGAITAYTETQISWMAIGAGFLVGTAVRWGGRSEGGVQFGVAGAAIAALSCFIGNILAIYIYGMKELSVGFSEAFAMMPLGDALKAVTGAFDFMDILFLACAVFLGYTTAAAGSKAEAANDDAEPAESAA